MFKYLFTHIHIHIYTHICVFAHRPIECWQVKSCCFGSPPATIVPAVKVSDMSPPHGARPHKRPPSGSQVPCKGRSKHP